MFPLPFFYVCKRSESVMKGTKKILKYLFGVILCMRPTVPGRKPPKCDIRHNSSISKFSMQVCAHVSLTVIC